MALALHELAVNAARHGALRGESGQLKIRWRIRRNGGNNSWLEFDWLESGVPTPACGRRSRGAPAS